MSVATYAAAQLLRLLPRSGLSHAVGKLCSRPLPPMVSRVVTGMYIRAYDVDMADVASARGTYPSFDAFFTRPLKTGARQIGAGQIVSPADGVLVATGAIDAHRRILVKGRPYETGELVGDDEEGRGLAGGTFAVIYLSPRDYHRVHSPIDGKLTLIRGISGDLFPVNSIGERHVPNLFVKNQRVAMTIEAPQIGPVVVVMVGAMIVGRITVSAVPSSETPLGVYRLGPPRAVARGDEIGAFHLGSTVVLLAGPRVAFSRPIGPVRYGEPLSP